MMAYDRMSSLATRNIVRDVSGSIVIVFALVFPIILALVGGAIDYGLTLQKKMRLQNTSDAAVIAAARELHLATADTSHLQSVVEAVVRAHLGPDASWVKIATAHETEPLSVSVDLTQSVEGVFLPQFQTGSVKVRSVANVSGGTPLCVLSLGDLSGAISLEANARLTGNECAVYSNSKSPNGIISKSGAQLRAELICSAGGMVGGTDNYEPYPLTDCPPIQDPLADRPPPPVGPCTATDLKIGVPENYKSGTGTQKVGLLGETLTESTSADASGLLREDKPQDSYEEKFVSLSPGTYCGGLVIGGAVRVTLLPGIYVMKGGPLLVNEYASVEGEHVGFFFTGRNSTLYLGANTTISLKAPKVGPMAGLLMYQDRNSSGYPIFSILSDNARVLEGTLYLPKASLFVDADKPIADQSAYTAIITKRMELYGGPHVVLNTDYDKTEVPVPPGIAHDRRISLAE